MTEEERQRRKPTRKEVLEGGRLLGVIARSDPELYAAITEMAEEAGESPFNVTITMLRKYMMIQKVQYSNINMEQLMVAFDIFSSIAKEVIKMYTTLAAVFFSELTSSMARMVDERIKEREAARPVEDKLKDKLVSMVVNILEPMIMDIVRSSYRAAGSQLPESLKVKVPVTITVKEPEGQEGNSL